ncbi:MAG: glycosyltransferase [Lentisphaerae bacterium]|nr:glycosyltransferase [Lentisphaerota bacterium]
MRILAIDHNAVFRSYRPRYAALAAMDDSAVTVGAPSSQTFGATHRLEPKQEDEPFELVRLPTVGGFKSHRGLYCPLALRSFLKRDADLLFVDSEPESFAVAECLALGGRRKKLAISTWGNINFAATRFPYRLHRLHRAAYRHALRSADGILCYSHEAPDILRANGYRGAIAQIDWGVDVARFRPRDSGPLRESLGLRGFVVGYSGRLVEEKGVMDLVEAAAGLADPKSLLIAGDGPMRAALVQRAADLSLHTVFAGPVPQASMPDRLNCMDVLVLPSRTTPVWKEQFGKVLIEAMACGVPSVGSSSGEIPRVIGDGALVFPEGDVPALRSILVRLQADRKGHGILSNSARRRAETVFSWPVVALRMREIFAEVLGHAA